MRVRRGVLLAPLAAALVALAACAGPRPAPPTTAGDFVEVARFGDARALGVDAAGRLYVVDAAASAVVVLDTLGRRLSSFGGAGTGAYALLDPADVDPTNGLELFVADAGNGRVQRVSSDGRLLESLAVPREAPDDEVPERRPAGEDGQSGEGRPVAVAVGPAGALYVAEAGRGVVLRWDDASRRRVREVGGPAAGAGALVEPVGLAVGGDGALFVADRGRGEVVVFDPYGSFLRTIPAPSVRAVALATMAEGERLLVVGPSAVSVRRPDGGPVTERVLDGLREEAIDAAVVGGALVVLTPTGLFRARL